MNAVDWSALGKARITNFVRLPLTELGMRMTNAEITAIVKQRFPFAHGFRFEHDCVSFYTGQKAHS